MKSYLNRGHIVIENVSPEVNCGQHRAKAVVGDFVEISAEIFRDGPDLLQAVIRYRGPSDGRWQEAPLALIENDRWAGTFRPTEMGRFKYTIEAWTDRFSTWRRALMKKLDAGQDVATEIAEGELLIESRLKAAPARDRAILKKALEEAAAAKPPKSGPDPRAEILAAPAVVSIMTRIAERSDSSTYKPTLELTVDRERARCGAWYEFFPRSTGTKTKHGTFKTAAAHLKNIAAMGFDVVYLPPIHPIGHDHRKGKNNSLTPGPDDVGSPWAIGAEAGGHTDIHPDLGTIDDFDGFVAEASRLGLEVALDFAIQCSPDHPWVKEHPEWFHHRPDGTIKYAENPPKKYQDIYPINFDTEAREELWNALKGVLDFWISHGVKIFRVDNPHTKPIVFWEWMIDSIQKEHPEVILLSEAFTRPKVMGSLAKIGFTQSYTYFTWRNNKHELTEYMLELTRTEMANYFRPNFFVNTPDILHEFLQTGGPPAFKIRLVLAALLSPSYGVYSGFELFENKPAAPGSEEYLNSEKYELRPRDLKTKNSLVPYIKHINEIRRKHPSLSQLTNLQFHDVDKDHIIAFSKTSSEGDTILAIVNLNPWHWEEGTVHLDLSALGVDPSRPFEVHDLVTDATFTWYGPSNYVRLDPHVEPAHIFRVDG